MILVATTSVLQVFEIFPDLTIINFSPLRSVFNDLGRESNFLNFLPLNYWDVEVFIARGIAVQLLTKLTFPNMYISNFY